jgi:hypothetical protein
MRTKKRAQGVALFGSLALALAAPPALATSPHHALVLRRDGSKAVPAVIAPALATSPHHALVLRRDGSKAVPVVIAPAPSPGAKGIDVGDAGIGAGSGIAALLLALAGVRAVRSRRAERQSPATALEACAADGDGAGVHSGGGPSSRVAGLATRVH